MKDKELESKLRLLGLQLDNWKKLHDLITYGLDKSKPIISSEQERQFTEIRSNLLQESAHILERLNAVSELSGKVMNVLQRASSVRSVRELTGDEVRRMEMEWNGVFTKLGILEGKLKAQRKMLAEQTVLGYYLGRFLGRFAPAH